jgi:hypothetical protein
MKTLTKKFRAVVHDGLPHEGWHEEQTGETLLPDDALAFEADTLDELRSALFAAGVTVPDVPTEPEQPTYTQLEYANAVEARFDREAQALGYDNLAKATTYVASGNNRFAAEARHFIALRDACWALCFDALANPPEIPPTPAEFAEAIVAKALAEVGQPIYS